MRVRIDGDNDVRPPTRRETDFRPCFVHGGSPVFERFVDDFADRTEPPLKFAVVILDADKHVFVSRQALPGAGRSEQRLVPQALAEALDQAVDRRRLVAGGLEGRDELEVGHGPILPRRTHDLERPF
jgi:hypothetical protein